MKRSGKIKQRIGRTSSRPQASARTKTPQAAKSPIRLHRRKPLARELRRIARGQIDSACRVLESNEDPRRVVHEARKSLKKLRAILKLVAPEFGRRHYQAEKRVFQDAARLLAPLRDAEVRATTLDALIKGAGLAREDFAEIRGEFEAATNRFARSAARPKHRAVKILRLARPHVSRWPLDQIQWKDLAKEIKRSYRKGRKALRAYQQEPGPEAFHAWRKRAKELWYHLRITENYLPGAFAKVISQCDKIGELAGNAHDLTVLHETLATRKTRAQTALLLGEIDMRMPGLYRDAVENGVRLYAEKPRDFAKRMES